MLLDMIKVAPGTLWPTAHQGLSSANEPDGWLLCDGRAISRTEYPALFGAIGTAFGEGDGSTTFNIPDMRGRAPVGIGQGDTGEGGGQGTERALGDKGGEEAHTLTEGETPEHSHGAGGLSTNSTGSHTHGSGSLGTNSTGNHSHGGTIDASSTENSGSGVERHSLSASNVGYIPGSTDSDGSHSHTISGSTGSSGSHSHSVSGDTGNAGGGNAHNNMAPYLAVNWLIRA